MQPETVFLTTEGYQLVFQLQPLADPDREDELDFSVSFSCDPRLGGFTIPASPISSISIFVKDLRSLVAYFKEHIAHLQVDPDSESYTFVPLDLQFQLQALSGEIRSPDDGEFTLLCMINVGKYEGSSYVYMGGQARVTLENINRFLASLLKVLDGMNHEH